MKNILIVEDEPDLREILVAEVRNVTQYTITEAGDGVQAYQKARNQRYDIVMTDFNMPKISGADLINTIRQTDRNENVPIIIYTGALAEAKTACKGIKGIEYIEKPAENADICDLIQKHVNYDPEKKSFTLDVDFINPFIDSSIKILEGICGVENITAQKPYLMNVQEELDIDISGTLAVTSPYFRGSIAVSFANEIYTPIISKMDNEKASKIDADNQDGAAEIISLIFGQTKAELAKKGFDMQRAIPSVMRGHNHKIYQDLKIPVLLVPFNSDVGRFYMQICVKPI